MPLANSRLTVFRLIVVAVIVIATWGGLSTAGEQAIEADNAQWRSAAQDSSGSTPESTPPSPGISTLLLGEYTVLANPDGDGDKYLTGYSALTFVDPNALSGKHNHSGPFLMEVTEGAICYFNTSMSQDAIVFAVASEEDTSPSRCETSGTTPNHECAGPDGCVLAANQVVYLPAGSWVSHVGTTVHAISNPSGGEQAVILVTGREEEGYPRNCAGTCWRW